jgi:hypothetical protein
MRISEKFCYRAGESRPEREQLSVNAHLKSVERLSEGCRASRTGVTSEAMFPGATGSVSSRGRGKAALQGDRPCTKTAELRTVA